MHIAIDSTHSHANETTTVSSAARSSASLPLVHPSFPEFIYDPSHLSEKCLLNAEDLLAQLAKNRIKNIQKPSANKSPSNKGRSDHR